MVRKVIGRGIAAMRFDPKMESLFRSGTLGLACKLPWEHMVISSETHRESTRETRRETTQVAIPPPQLPAPSHGPGPGCTAADNAGVALYHLEGLANEGKPNFGVLRISKERLEEGAAAADRIGRRDMGAQMRRIASQLPQVHDQAEAARVAGELRPLAYQLWDLGAQCKGAVSSPGQSQRIRALAQRVRKGELTMEQAASQLRGGE